MIVNLILLILLILAVFFFYLLNRNNKVYCFKVSLSNLLLEELKRILNTYKNDDEFHEDEINYNYMKGKVEILLNRHSYNKCLFSFKPLKLEKWFTEEDLEFMEYLKQYRKSESSNLTI